MKLDVEDIELLFIGKKDETFLTMKKLLKDTQALNYSITQNNNLGAIKKLIKAHAYSVYLIDYENGERDVFELLTAVKPASHKEIFIILADNFDRKTESEVIKVGADDYLVKNKLTAELLQRSIIYGLNRKYAERQKIRHLIELNQAKDEFIAVASHQLRTPASGVKQYLGILLTGLAGDLSKKQLRVIEKAYKSNEKEFKELFNLDEFMKDLIADAKLFLVKESQAIRCDDVRVKVFSDRLALRLALTNLIENASKYSKKDDEIRIAIDETDSKVVISVADQGVGIAAKNLDKVFEKFVRIEDNQQLIEGSGLGLYIVKTIIKELDGEVKIESELGKGTVVKVVLPKA